MYKFFLLLSALLGASLNLPAQTPPVAMPVLSALPVLPALPVLSTDDASQIARQLVKTIAPRPGEHAIIAYDPSCFPEITLAVQSEFLRAGVYPVVLLNFDPPEIVDKAPSSLAEIKKQEEEFFALLRPAFAQAQIFLWMPARSLYDDHRWERLIEASPVRAIHFHWFLPLERGDAHEIRKLSAMYQRAVVDTDYPSLSRFQSRLIAGLRGQTIRITTPDGTDLRLRVPADAWFHKNDGDMSSARARDARSVRDREMELPAGALRFIPDPAFAEGRIALPRLPLKDGVAEDVVLEYQNGRIVRMSAKKNEEGLRRYFQEIGGDIDRVGEIVVGTNPLLAERLPSGFAPYYGYGSGYLRISLGDDWESGGTLRSPASNPVWLIFDRASLQAGERRLIVDGQFMEK
ncbi:MAG: aminopeptidase [Acidipila sp.]|nr:aminopeptidase [Acidipila sp.]